MDNYYEIAKRISNASRNNSLTFFVGAGVSKCSGIPGWGDLIGKIWKEMGKEDKKDFSSDEFLSIPQMFYYSLKDKKKYKEFIRTEIDRPDAIPNDVHRLMLKFHPASFLTTNYDHLLEAASVEYCQSYKCVASDEEVPSINGDRFILKVHGDIEHKHFVLKEEDYLAYEDNFKLISTLMRSVFSTNTVVFIGYRIGDNNVKLILDWVRRVLKEKFNPIFIRTEDEPLSDEEEAYYKSRGLDVIELSKVTTIEERGHFPKNDYIPRYSAVLNYIEKVSEEKKIGETEEESFSILFNRLKPLDKLSALRTDDIQERLSGCCNISNVGHIYIQKGMEGLFDKFISVHELSPEKRKEVSPKDNDKYKLIRRVFNKGGVHYISHSRKTVSIYDENTTFADDNCIMFDYSTMASYCKVDYIKIGSKYKKAFYLTRLHRYEEAFDAFLEVAKETFRNKDYVLFYIAEINCIALKKVFKNPLIRFNKDKELEKKEEKLILSETASALFDGLPQEFKSEYKSLQKLCTNEILYQYGFEASTDALKLEKSLSTHTIESGETSSLKVISRVNEYLHFLLGNGICLDLFSEYQASVCTLMKTLIRKYSDQQRRTLINASMLGIPENRIYFDQYDFYCFVRFFKASDLERILRSSKIKYIEFENMDCVETAIQNLLSYTEKMIKEAKTPVEYQRICYEMEACLVLTAYMRLSEKLVEEICQFIFKYDIGDFTIDKKILFLKSQICGRQVTNERIRMTLENAIIKYCKDRMIAISHGDDLNLHSHIHGVDYPNIADYLNIDNYNFTSRRLSKMVEDIIDKRVVKMQREAVEHYYGHISQKQKKRLLNWVEDMLTDGFDFERFTLLLEMSERKAKGFSDTLLSYLEKIEKGNADSKTSKVETFPKPIPHAELLNVGFWCMCGFLDSKKFSVFKGIDDEFDFLIDPMNYDYSKFNVGWLITMNRRALMTVTKRATVKNKIQNRILQEIKKDEIKQDDRERLVYILGEHFTN